MHVLELVIYKQLFQRRMHLLDNIIYQRFVWMKTVLILLRILLELRPLNVVEVFKFWVKKMFLALIKIILKLVLHWKF